MSKPHNDEGASLTTTPPPDSTHNNHPGRIFSLPPEAGKESLTTAACYCRAGIPCSTCRRFDAAIGAAYERKETSHE